MKNVKGMIAFVALLLVSNAHAMSNYNNFQSGYRGEIITPSNMVSMAWVQGSVDALLRDGAIANQADSRISTILWSSLTPVLNYYMNLPQNRSNSYFRDRIWQSLNRSVAEMPRMAMSSVMTQAQDAQADTLTLKALASVRDFTSQLIKINPSNFYYAGSISPAWLRNTLGTALGDGSRQLTMQNKALIKEALVDIVEALTLQMFVEGKSGLNPRVQDAIIVGVKNQAAQFIDAQPVSR